jgi:hypothetical protein
MRKRKPTNSSIYPDAELRYPTVLMDRIDDSGNDWSHIEGRAAGDILTSQLFDLDSTGGYSLSIAVQRTRKRESWDRGFGDAMLIGPEPRAIMNGDPLVPFDPPTAASHQPDSLIVEFAFASSLQEALNPSDTIWRRIERTYLEENDPNRFETEIPALAVFGGGGYMTAFSEAGPEDTIYSRPTESYRGGLRANVYDTGIDHGFEKYFVRIPPAMTKLEGARNFRFRVRVAATDDQKCTNCIPDDNDEFFVDNVTLLPGNDESTDMEATRVRAILRYTSRPSLHATQIPIKVKVSNNTTTNAPFYFVAVIIYKADIEKVFEEWETIDDFMYNHDASYCRKLTIPQHLGLTNREWDLPAFNGRDWGEGKYMIVAYQHIPGGDIFDYNDAMISGFELKFSDGFQRGDGINSVSELSGDAGRGLSLYGYSEGGWGNEEGYKDWFESDTYPYGAPTGIGEGSIAVKFDLIKQDSILGYSAFFTQDADINDDVEYAIYKDEYGELGEIIEDSRHTVRKAWDEQSNTFRKDAYSTVYLYTPVVLEKGSYWMAVKQNSGTALNLGASGYNAGQKTLDVSIDLPYGEMGLTGKSINIHDDGRIEDDKRIKINWNTAAYKNWDGEWKPFTPTVGNTGFPHLPHTGTSPVDNITQTLTQGTWQPMLQPIINGVEYEPRQQVAYCPQYLEDTIFFRPRIPWLPVELTSFNARATARGIDLNWETASETDNYGFYIEREDVTEGVEDEFTQIGFVKGNGTTTSISRYGYADKNVVNGHTYSYKLRQVDRDGAQSCFETLVQTVEFDGEKVMDLAIASPNPFGATAGTTSIDYSVPETGMVTLEIIDIFGNPVKTLVAGQKPAGHYSVRWDATDNMGKAVATGTYIYRLTTAGETLTNKVQYRK